MHKNKILLLLLSLYSFNSTPEPRMYSKHEGNRTGGFILSWGQPNKRVHIRTIEAPRTPRSWGGGRYESRSHASQKHEDPGGGKTTRAPPRTTDVARQHDTCRPQCYQKSGGLNPAPGEHIRWAVLSLEPGTWGNGWVGHLDWGFVWGCIPVNAQGAQWNCRCILWMHRKTIGIVLSLEMDQESSRIVLVYVYVYEACRRNWLRVRYSIFYILYSIFNH